MINKTTAVAYMRYSSHNQDETSIEYQRRVITEYCEKNNMVLVKEYVDEGITGTTDKRDSFQLLIADVKSSPEWNNVIVYDYSRFSRDIVDSVNYARLLDLYGINLISVTQTYDKTNEGQLMRNVTFAFNEYYSKNNGKMTHAALTTRAQKGLHCGGVPPLGYDLDEDGKLTINGYEARIVQEIFDMYEKGYSYAKMAKILNDKGYTSKYGRPFSKNSFSSILQQEKYIGKYVWNKVIYKDVRGVRTSKHKDIKDQVIAPDMCPEIINPKQFERVNELLHNKAGKRPISPRNHYMLSNLKILKCEECGAYLIGAKNNSHGKEYEIYYCPNHKMHSCSMPQIQAKNLNALVARLLVFEIYKRKDLDKIFDIVQNNENIKKLKRQLEGKKLAIENVLKAIENDYNKLLTKRLSKLQAEKEVIEQRLNDEKAKISTFNRANTKKVMKKLAKYLITSEDVAVKQYLQDTIKEIIISHDDVEIKYVA